MPEVFKTDLLYIKLKFFLSMNCINPGSTGKSDQAPLTINASCVRDTALVLNVSKDKVISALRKLHEQVQYVNTRYLIVLIRQNSLNVIFSEMINSILLKYYRLKSVGCFMTESHNLG